MNKQVEYEALKEEILFSMQTVKNYRTLLYTIIIAALAFAFDKNEAILFLVLFCAIIPIGRPETLGFMMKSIKYLQKI